MAVAVVVAVAVVAVVAHCQRFCFLFVFICGSVFFCVTYLLNFFVDFGTFWIQKPPKIVTKAGWRLPGSFRRPKEAQGSPKASQNSSKIEVLGPGWPPRSPKAPPGSKKSPKWQENRWKTSARPRGKIRDSDAPQEAFSEGFPKIPRKKYSETAVTPLSCTTPSSAAV